jgi:hypothetical protein
MAVTWEISKNDIETTQRFIEEFKNCSNAQKRVIDNVLLPVPPISKEIMWEVMFDCLLSSMQRSGPSSPIAKFMNIKPFPLNLTLCLSEKEVGTFVEKILSDNNCNRFRKQIGISAEKNIELFDGNNWDEFKHIISPLCQARTRTPEINDQVYERKVSHWLDSSFRGFGPKQSRNYIQLLGISRYEIPIDSRFVNWLINNNFLILINGKMLREIDRKYLNTLLSVPYWYDLILDKIQEMCIKSNILPCILDGCVFGSFDADD